MSNNNPWYTDPRYRQNQGHQGQPQQHQHPQQHYAAPNPVPNGQRLLAAYPPASATPTNHAVRHIPPMTLGNTPTFHSHNYYPRPDPGYSNSNRGPHGDYDQRLQYIANPQTQANDSSLWQNTRNDASRMLGGHSQPPVYAQPMRWSQPEPVTSYQTPPFAQSVFHRVAPTTAYPTPPPPSMNASSSSLAGALVMPQQSSHSQQLPPPRVYHPHESTPFFDEYLDRKTRPIHPLPPKPALVPIPTSQPPPRIPRIEHSVVITPQRLPPQQSPIKPPLPPAQPIQPQVPNRPVTPPSNPPPTLPSSSPDPLLLPSRVSQASVSTATPLKRKPVVEMSSPSVKRLHFTKSLTSSTGSIASVGTAPPSSQSSTEINTPSTAAKTPTSKAPPTPSSTATSFSRYSSVETPTHKRPVNLAYVAVPPSPHVKTPFSANQGASKSSLETPDDLGGYGSETSPVKPRSYLDSIKSSARRTGDRDERGPLEKFLSLMEDIFEAEDSLPSDIELNDLSPEYFSFLSPDASRPMLSSGVIRKLIKYITQVARPTKRHRQTNTGVAGTPRGKGRMTDLDPNQLGRLLKILDRSVKAGEDIDAFPQRLAATGSKVSASPRKAGSKKSSKPKKGEGRSMSQSPNAEDETQDVDVREEQPASTQLYEMDYQELTRNLGLARESIIAADCCIALLASDRLTKQLYSEELITSCFSAVKGQLTKILYPFVEASAEAGLASSVHPLLQSITKNTSAHAPGHRQQIGELFQALSAVIPRINDLVNAESVAMSDSIIIQTVYIAIGPFFVIDAGGDEGGKGKKDNAVIKTLGKSAMRGLRLDALSLIRSVFANHEDQRSWIIEEILSSLIKLSDSKQKAGQFKLRDGRSIRTVSALLMQLVQTSAHDVRIQARKIHKTRQNKFALKRQESMSESQPPAPEPLLDDTDHEEIRLYGTALDSATKAAKAIIVFLTQKSGKGKATKNSNEAEYRTIFDHLIEDMLVVLFWPEWPAAALILSIASKFMVALLDDVKTNAAIDTAAAKAMALDHLGVIAARLRTSTLKVQKEAQQSSIKALRPLEEILRSMHLKSLNRLLDAHQDVTAHLCKRSSEDQAYDSARDLTAATLGQEFAVALQRVNQRIEDPDGDDLRVEDEAKLLPFGQRLKAALRDLWKDQGDVFDVGSQEEVARIDSLSEEIGTIQALRHSFNPILSTILGCLDAQAVNMRTKAIRALGSIVISDPSILSLPNVRRGIESHLRDSSPAVRDAAVELIGKYIIETPELAKDYYPKIAERIADTGLGVRKRVIKLLKSVYFVLDDKEKRTDIASRFVLRMLDEDDTVKDLTIKTIEEIWFSPTPTPSTLKGKAGTSSGAPQDKSALLSKVAVIMATAARFNMDRQSPLEDVLHKIMASKEGAEATAMHARYGEICEALIDSLVDASDLPDFTVINCIRTIYLLTSAYPPILTGPHASTLLPYLKNASSAEELATSDYLLKIFRVTIPHMPRTASKFGQELQTALQPMIIKPSIGHGAGMQLLQETVGCMCVVVKHLTHDYARLVNLLKSCINRLQQTIKRSAGSELPNNEATALTILIFIVSLLVEHCNFDVVRLEQPTSSLANDLNAISQDSITEHVYNLLLTLYEKHTKPALRGRILQCLGFLFQAQPTLMTLERSASIMDAIFNSPDQDERGRLLKIIQEFLIAEAEKHNLKEKESAKAQPKTGDINMDELIGNTDGFADSGVSSAIVQRYLDHVLDLALSPKPAIQMVAMDVLSFTIRQGLAHPLQSFPVLIALETSSAANISNRASALHAILQGKHASLLNTRYTISARASFDYQKKVSDNVQGYRSTPQNPQPLALLQRWYSHAREKRQTRLEYLKSLIKVFQENESYEASVDDVEYTRYMAENFASFDYKTSEEVFTVIRFLTHILSTTGMHLLEMVSPSHLLNQLHEPTTQSSSTPVAPPADSESMARFHLCLPQPVVLIASQDISESNAATQPPPSQALELKIPVMRTSVIICIIMLLKAHLKTLYGFSEDKCIKFPVGKKSAAGDKAPVRRHENPISWSRLPFASTPLLTNEDAQAQRATFLSIWNEDGVIAEPEDDEYL